MTVTGEGHDENGVLLQIQSCNFKPVHEAPWKGYLELADRIEPLEVPSLTISEEGIVSAPSWTAEESGLNYQISG